MLGSFKVKLVVYFLLLSLLPAAAAVWGFASVAGQSETRRVDARLQGGLRAVDAAYQERVDAAQREATALARSPQLQRALVQRDRAAIVQLLEGTHGISVTAGGGFHVLAPPAFAATREVSVVSPRGLIGSVTGAVPFDETLTTALRAGSGLAAADTLVILRGAHIAAAAPRLAGTVAAPAGRTLTVSVGGRRYRALAAPAVSGAGAVRFAVLTPQSAIDAANASSRDRLLLGVLVSLLLVALVAYLEGRAIVRRLRKLADAASGVALGRLGDRVPVEGKDEFAKLAGAFNDMANQLQTRLAELEDERGRLRDAITRFGEALAATHDVGTLLRVIVEASVEATGAAGARLVAEDGRIVETGDPDVDGEQLQFPLMAGRTTFGSLTLVGPAFDTEERMTANSLASHAAIALENARLHRIVERQALVDGLTGIANRRHCEEALAHEIARSERLGAPLTVVIADLDDFKLVNDVHGHSLGDEVLREFATVLKATVRDSDLAGRWGGEEFLLLLPGADAAGGANLAERIRTVLHERAFSGRDGEVVSVTSSFGVAQHRVGRTPKELFAAADRALYRAKRDGKDRVETDAPVRSF